MTLYLPLSLPVLLGETAYCCPTLLPLLLCREPTAREEHSELFTWV